MIREYIASFLEGGREPNAEVLKEMSDRFLTTTYRQFMTERALAAPGKFYPSSSTKCVRQSGIRHAGFESAPIDSETLFKFWYGDLVEAGFVGLAQLALQNTPHSIGQNNAHIPVTYGIQHREHPDNPRNGYIDGLINFDHEYHWERFKKGLRPRWLPQGEKEDLLLEVKSMGSYAFNMFLKEGPNDTWGYLGQINSYLRELDIKRFCYVAIDKEKGRIAEWLGDRNERYTRKADVNYDTVINYAAKGEVPPMPTDQELVGVKPNGELNVVCSYCGYREPCMALLGYRIQSKEVRTRYGLKTYYYAIPDEPGVKTVKEEAEDKIRELIPESESGYSRG